MLKTGRVAGVLILGVATVSAGCATKKYVRASIEETESWATDEIDALQSQIEDDQVKLAEHDQQLTELSSTAQDALQRAIEAGHLAEGKFLYETVLASDRFRFDFDKSNLSNAAKGALDQFAVELKGRNENVFVEVQGHTDATGTDEYNLKLGEERAEEVRRYLSKQHGLALHRLAVISYGEAAPLADNATRDGRSENRRVALVVLK